MHTRIMAYRTFSTAVVYAVRTVTSRPAHSSTCHLTQQRFKEAAVRLGVSQDLLEGQTCEGQRLGHALQQHSSSEQPIPINKTPHAFTRYINDDISAFEHRGLAARSAQQLLQAHGSSW